MKELLNKKKKKKTFGLEHEEEMWLSKQVHRGKTGLSDKVMSEREENRLPKKKKKKLALVHDIP